MAAPLGAQHTKLKLIYFLVVNNLDIVFFQLNSVLLSTCESK